MPKGESARGVGVNDEDARWERPSGEAEPNGEVEDRVEVATAIERERKAFERACAASMLGWKRSGNGEGATRSER